MSALDCALSQSQAPGREDWRGTVRLSGGALQTLNKQFPEDLQPSARDAPFQRLQVAVVQVSVPQLKEWKAKPVKIHFSESRRASHHLHTNTRSAAELDPLQVWRDDTESL